MTANFDFLVDEWPALHEDAAATEANARRTLEKILNGGSGMVDQGTHAALTQVGLKASVLPNFLSRSFSGI